MAGFPDEILPPANDRTNERMKKYSNESMNEGRNKRTRKHSNSMCIYVNKSEQVSRDSNQMSLVAERNRSNVRAGGGG